MANFDLSKLMEGKNPQSVIACRDKRTERKMGTNWTS